MLHATDADLTRCADAAVPIVLCPRSNAFFGMTPDIPRMIQSGVQLLLGTDNAMINVASMLREIEFAYRVARMNGGATAGDTFELAVRGWHLADPGSSGEVRVGEGADLVVFDLPRVSRGG